MPEQLVEGGAIVVVTGAMLAAIIGALVYFLRKKQS